MRILLTGATGQVGHALAPLLARLGHLTRATRADLDLADPTNVARKVTAWAPDIIVNAAAFTAVDAAEQDRELAFRVNADAPGIIARTAAARGALLVHFSTDYVFSGTGRRPYREDDPTGPCNAYGASKLAGEEAIRASGARHLILRTAWVYGAYGQNFARTMLRLARERETLRVVADQRGAPTWAGRLAATTAQLLQHAAPPSGTYHLTNAGETTWYDFAVALLAADPARHEQRCRAVEPITTADYPTPARRPPYSVLDTSLIQRTFGITLPDWRDDVPRALSPGSSAT
jgi:dTDP-4-dehydrorhamnose reductase